MSSRSRHGGYRIALAGVAVIALLACGACSSQGRDGAVAGRPALLLVTVDGLVAEEMSPFGGPTAMPTLDRLARRGTAWPGMWSATPQTRPAVATYLTGLAPDRHGVRDDLFTALAPGLDTLPGRLREAGFKTAAFPDSHFLGFASGLLEDFAIADEPPPAPLTPDRWIPRTRPMEETVDDLLRWLATIEPGEAYFVWVHFSEPLVEQLDDLAPPRESRKAQGAGEAAPEAPALSRLDAQLGRLVAALEERGDLERGLLVVAGTQGNVRGVEGTPPGPGFSLDPVAVRIPLVVAGAALEVGRGGESPVWSLDVPATLAEVAGMQAGQGAEGVSLAESVDEERPMYVFSWATRDQMGWKPLRGVAAEGLLRVEGRGEDFALAGALSRRLDSSRHVVPFEAVSEPLERTGLVPDPVPAGGREFEDAEVRREVAAKLWAARAVLRRGDTRRTVTLLDEVLELDGDNLAALLERGQMGFWLGQPEQARLFLTRAAERYPDDPEVLHWYAHGIWSESWEDAEALLLELMPFKPREFDVLYDLACTRSLAGDLSASEDYLRRSIEAGFRKWPQIEEDADLRHLRESGRLSRLLHEYRR